MATMESNVYLFVEPEELARNMQLQQEAVKIADSLGVHVTQETIGENVLNTYTGTPAELEELYFALVDAKVQPYLITAETLDECDQLQARFAGEPVDVEWRPKYIND